VEIYPYRPFWLTLDDHHVPWMAIGVIHQRRMDPFHAIDEILLGIIGQTQGLHVGDVLQKVTLEGIRRLETCKDAVDTVFHRDFRWFHKTAAQYHCHIPLAPSRAGMR
jgi:hypothetical protein